MLVNGTPIRNDVEFNWTQLVHVIELRFEADERLVNFLFLIDSQIRGVVLRVAHE